jgi:tryptophanyl-tRNA synthetase
MHQIYSDQSTQNWVQEGCKSAGIGCVDCKRPIIESIQQELAPIRERAKNYESEPQLVKNIIIEGSEVARDAAKLTMQEVRQAMGLIYR